MHWLAQDAPKFAKDQFTKLCRLTSGAIRDGAKITSETHYLIQSQVLGNNQRALPKRKKTPKMSEIWFWVHYLAEYAPKSVKDQFTKLSWLTLRHLREEVKIISKLLFVTQRLVLRKNQRLILTKARPKICLRSTDPILLTDFRSH